jgi:hypothetical protein
MDKDFGLVILNNSVSKAFAILEFLAKADSPNPDKPEKTLATKRHKGAQRRAKCEKLGFLRILCVLCA